MHAHQQSEADLTMPASTAMTMRMAHPHHAMSRTRSDRDRVSGAGGAHSDSTLSLGRLMRMGLMALLLLCSMSSTVQAASRKFDKVDDEWEYADLAMKMDYAGLDGPGEHLLHQVTNHDQS
jgi:hypothetical protein